MLSLTENMVAMMDDQMEDIVDILSLDGEEHIPSRDNNYHGHASLSSHNRNISSFFTQTSR